MSLYVVDASIAIKVYVPEIHSAQAIRFFSDEHELIVPEFMLAEFANIVWKKSALLGELTEAESKTSRSRIATRLLLHQRIAH